MIQPITTETIEIPKTETQLAIESGYSRWFVQMAKRAGFRHSHGGGRSPLPHWLGWLKENPEFKPSDYRDTKFCLRRHRSTKTA